MKKIKIVSMFLTLAILITSLNLGLMFTSFADTVIQIDEASDLSDLSSNIGTNSGTITINLTKDIDASSILPISSIDASGKTIIFNGENHLIKNLHLVGGGLFTNVGANSEFSELGMYNCSITDFAAASKEGYGFLAGKMDSGSIDSCFVDGVINVVGTPKYIGGLVGQFGGTLINSYAMTDIYTDGSYVGGLIGEFTGSANSISACYATGSIDNSSREYIGGLIGYSETACVTNSYTSMCILHPYADTVKSIGVIKGLNADSRVYYDENLSLQKQGDMDPHRCSPSEIRANLNADGYWLSVDTDKENGEGYYPQLSVFYNSTREPFKRISAISAVVVDVDRSDNLTTGREFTIVSTTSHYSFATLTNRTGNGENLIEWRISGGVDEYYFDPNTATESEFPTNNGAVLNGLSGNTFDTNTGKYLFVNTGDIKFTAVSDIYERDIYVHVTTYDTSPYFPKSKASEVVGTGSAESPFIINSLDDLNMIRVYCLDDEVGKYHYSINFGTTATAAVINLADIDWLPIVGMKGTLLGNNHNINNLNVTKANEGGAGFFATISNTAFISDLHISNASIKPVGECNKAGVLSGEATNANITNLMVTGVVEGAVNGGVMSGEASGNTTVSNCVTYGVVSATEAAGGFFGTTDEGVNAVDCYSGAVVFGAKSVGGFYGAGKGNVEFCVFTGNLGPGLEGVKHGLVVGGTALNSYYDWQAAGIHNSTSENAKTTDELRTPDGVLLNDNWVWQSAGSNSAAVKNELYPQLKVFTTNTDLYTFRTSNMAAFPIDYGSGSSISFDSITTDKRYEHVTTNANRPISTPAPYGEGSDGYSFTSSGNNLTIKVETGGMQMYSFTANLASLPCDTKYVLFNVRTITVNYKFTYASDDENNAYNSDMSDKGLTYITSELGAKYGEILNSTLTSDEFLGKFSISPAGDLLSFDMVHAVKYNYTIEAYADKEMTNPIAVQIGNSVSISTLENVYINFIIEKNELPWGIYRLSCS